MDLWDSRMIGLRAYRVICLWDYRVIGLKLGDRSKAKARAGAGDQG